MALFIKWSLVGQERKNFSNRAMHSDLPRGKNELRNPKSLREWGEVKTAIAVGGKKQCYVRTNVVPKVSWELTQCNVL